MCKILLKFNPRNPEQMRLEFRVEYLDKAETLLLLYYYQA